MKNATPEKVLKWLQSQPSLDALGTEFPELRETVRCELAEIVTCGRTSELPEYLKRMSQNERILERKYLVSRGDSKIARALVEQAVRNRMAHLAIKQHLVSEATGIEKGKARFNLINGYIAQKLLFKEGLERKPVSMFWFDLLWPLIWQKRLLMPLVQPEGIYCFYSQQLITNLSRLIASRPCLEIAAGDGTLSRFLQENGVSITATDDYSWKHEVNYPPFVIKQEAEEALRGNSPEVVICSWPPANNSFERQVFRTKSVKLYIVIGSQHRFASGNWDEYAIQTAFDFEEDKQLSRQVLPPELDAAVYVFRRKPTGL